jgi:RNA polymerase sigma factor (sigma-70 family)
LRKKKELAFSSFENAEGKNAFVESLQDAGPGPNELLARAENTKFVAAILAQLDVRYREVLTLRYEDGLTFKKIGEVLRRPLHTVKSQHRRVLISLRRLMQG